VDHKIGGKKPLVGRVEVLNILDFLCNFGTIFFLKKTGQRENNNNNSKNKNEMILKCFSIAKKIKSKKLPSFYHFW
jgi:hypothetical protein